MSNNSTPLKLEEIALRALAQQAVANFLWIIFGIIGLLNNSLILVTIVKAKALHNKSHLGVFSHTVIAIIRALANTGAGLRRSVLYLTGQPGLLTQIQCTALQLTLAGSWVLEMFALLSLGIDRLLAIAAPIFYRSLRPLHLALAINIFCYGLTLAVVMSAFLTFPSPTIIVPVCLQATAFSSFFQKLLNAIGSICFLMIVMIYLTSSAKVGYRYWGKKWSSNAQRSDWAREAQLNAFKYTLIIGIANTSCLAAVLAIQYIVAWQMLPLALLENISPYLGLALFAGNVSNLFIYLGTNKKFRKAFLVVMGVNSEVSAAPIDQNGQGSRSVAPEAQNATNNVHC